MKQTVRSLPEVNIEGVYPRKNKQGEIISYRIRVSSGARGQKPYEATYPEKGMIIPNNWSKRTIEKEVKKYAEAFRAKCLRGEISTEYRSFSDYAVYVIETKESNGTKYSTLKRYKEMLERINDIDYSGFGYKRLSDIRVDHIDKFLSALGKNGVNKLTGGKLSNSTITAYRSFISTVFDFAFRKGAVSENIVRRTEAPKKQKHEAEHFEKSEVEEIISALDSEPLVWKALVHILLSTGARRGEVMGLQWQSVDFENNRLFLCNNARWSKERGIYHDTLKTGKNRFVSVPPTAMNVLKAWKMEQAEKRLLMGADWKNDGDYVFTKDNGREIYPDYVNTWLIRFAARHSLPHINPHKFRHTCCTLLLESGESIATVSKRLGHTLQSTTLDVYSHQLAGGDKQAAETIEEIVYANIK